MRGIEDLGCFGRTDDDVARAESAFLNPTEISVFLGYRLHIADEIGFLLPCFANFMVLKNGFRCLCHEKTSFKRRSCHFFCKGSAADDMEVQVENRLAGIGTAVGDHAITVINACELCDLGNVFKNISDDTAVFRRDFIYGSDMRFGDHENVNGRLRIDISESENFFVLVNLGGGNGSSDDFTKKTIFHNQSTFL